jgi:hypothetical protein
MSSILRRKKMYFKSALAILFASSVAPSAQSQNYDKIKYKVYEDEARFTISIPEDWSEEKSDKFSAVFKGKAKDAYCTVKRTVDWSFGVMTKGDYAKSITEKRQMLVDMLSLQFEGDSGKLVMLSEFPIGNHTGAILVTKGIMNDQNITSASYQIINASALHTVACFTLSENFGYYFPIFSNIGGSLTFLEVTD